MSKQLDYVIQGGEAGKSRLNILAAVMEPYTRALLLALGLKKGKSFIDNGTGGGHVALMAAGITGAKASVVATDADASILRLAAQEAEEKGFKNIEFVAAAIEDYQYREEFDFSYARFVLSHVQEPAMALQKMKEAVKPGGMVVVEDVQFSGHFCYPASKAFERYLDWYAAVVQRRHGNAEIGPRLPALLKEAGLTAISFDVVQPAFSAGEGKWMAWVTLDRITDALTAESIVDAAAIRQTLDELKAFTEDAQTIISLPRVFRVWGVKES
jgi:2-polyprenyl-3-methyl-5-hydroxy-6-metoxy-1,4-benzoquinol methylase